MPQSYIDKSGSTRRLSIKQKKFINKYIETSNGTQSALQAYDTKDPRVAQTIASENLSKPIIIQTIEEKLRAQDITVETITKNVNALASKEPEKVSAETILKANVELLKLLNAYPDKKSYRIGLSMSGKIKDLTYLEAKKQLEELNNTLTSLQDDETTQPIIDTTNNMSLSDVA